MDWLRRRSTAGGWRRRALPCVRPFKQVERIGDVRNVDLDAQPSRPRNEGLLLRRSHDAAADQFIDRFAGAATFPTKRLDRSSVVRVQLDCSPHAPRLAL